MPCRDWDDTPDCSYERRAINDLTKMLCACCKEIEKFNGPVIPKIAKDWWIAHKKEDVAQAEAERKRLEKEQKRKYILSKLTKEEKDILGIKD